MTADDILQGLVTAAGKAIWCKELQFSQGARRIDFWKLEPQPSKGYAATAYEIKISRADFKRDTHCKQREARLYSDKFYYVTPPGLLQRSDVPDWAGLLEFDGTALKKIVPAPLRDKDAPSWELVVSIIRYNGEIRRDVGREREIIGHLRHQIKNAQDRIKAAGRQPWEFGL